MASYVLTWKPLAGGHLAIGHKPGKKLRAQLDAQGCTLVVSLLSESESNASESEHRLRLPLPGADPPGPERRTEIIAVFERMLVALAQGGRVYLHCSAGLHRTGMIANAFLRWLGFSADDALALIAELRPLTAEKVGTERLRWGQGFARSSEPQPTLSAILALAVAHGQRHFNCKLESNELLENRLKDWLFGAHGTWIVLAMHIITQREARDLLIQKFHDFYRATLAMGGPVGPDCSVEEIAHIDRTLFGDSARDLP